MPDNELRHYGVKGMKWGVRRGRRRHSDDYTRTKKTRKKSHKRLSNQELKDLNYRLELERKYKQHNTRTIAKGSKFVTGMLGQIGRDIVRDAVRTKVRQTMRGKKGGR